MCSMVTWKTFFMRCEIERQEWNPNTSVLVAGVHEGQITENGSGVMHFKDLHEARQVFPEIDLVKSSKNFTGALGNSKTDAMRFETHKANDVYST